MVYRKTARSEKARAATRDALLAAAARLIRAHGYDGATMQDVVAEAGTSIGNVYFYFRNKDELFGETIRRAIDARWDASERLMEGTPVGPKRIAVVMYANITATLGQDVNVARAITEALDRMSHLREESLKRWRAILAECCPGLTEDELVATAIWGGNRTQGERLLDGSLARPIAEIASFAVRWNLRALRFSDAEIEGALRYARRRVGAASA